MDNRKRIIALIMLVFLSCSFHSCMAPNSPEKNAGKESDRPQKSEPYDKEDRKGQGSEVTEFESVTIVHGEVKPHCISQEPTNKEYIQAFTNGESEWLESRQICNDRDEYLSYIENLCAIFSDVDKKQFPEIATEWFSDHILACAFISIYHPAGKWQNTRILYEGCENGTHYLLLGIEGVEQAVSSLDPEPYQIGTFLHGLDRQKKEQITDLEVEVCLLGKNMQYLNEAQTIRERYSSSQSLRLSVEVSSLFAWNASKRDNGVSQEEVKLTYSEKTGLVYSKKYAEIPIGVRVELKTSLLREEIGKQCFRMAENALYQAFFLDHGINYVYHDGDAANALYETGGNSEEFGKVVIPDEGSAFSNDTPLKRFYVRVTPLLLEELLNDNRIIRLYI